MIRFVWGRWPIVVFCWLVGAVLVSFAAAGAASADSVSAPGNLSAAVSADDVVVSWTAPASGAVTYQVYRRVAIKGSEYKQIGTIGGTVFRDRVSGLSPGFEYYYRVKAVDSEGLVGGWGSGSNYASATTPAPSGLSAVLTADDVVVSWTASAGIVQEYAVYRRAAIKGDRYERIGTIGGTVFRDRVSGLSPGFEYYYRVKAVDSEGLVGGWGSGSNYASATTPAPSGLSAVLTADDVVGVTWTASAGIVQEYAVYRRAAIKGDEYKRITVTQSSYWSNAEVLRSGFEYYYRVRAVDSQGREGSWGSGSNYAALTIPAPRVLSAGYSAGSMEVNWTVPFGGAVIYQVYRRAAVKGSDYEQIGTTRATVYTDHVSGLTPGLEYYYRVKAVDSMGRVGGWGSGSNYGAGIYTPPPSSLSAVVSSGSVVVSWTAPAGDVREYVVYRRAAVKGADYKQIGTTSGSTVFRDPISGLSPGLEYYYRVKAVDRRGASGSWGTGYNYAEVKIP